MTDERQTDAACDLLRRAPSLAASFADFLSKQRWYGGKADTVSDIDIPLCMPLPTPGLSAFLFLVRVRYASGRTEEYAIPLKALSSEAAGDVKGGGSKLLMIEPEGAAPRFVFSDALLDRQFALYLLECIQRDASICGDDAQLIARSTEALGRLADFSAGPLEPSVMMVEQSNTSIKFGAKLILKFLRRAEEGVNLDVETGVFLTTRAHFQHTPSIAGSIEILRKGRARITLGVMQGFVENRGDAWKYTLQDLANYFRRTSALVAPEEDDGTWRQSLYRLAEEYPPGRADELIGAYLSSCALLGRRTAELHLALASDSEDSRFSPEPFSSSDRERACASMEQLAGRAFELLTARSGDLAPSVREKAQLLLSRQQDVMSRFRQLLVMPVSANRTRLHGDYHLGQVLYTGSDFVIIDFEGEPERPLAERRAKRSPLRDVAGMLRSLHYAARTALEHAREQPGQPAPCSLDRWAEYWTRWVSACFLRSYLSAAGSACFIPRGSDELRKLLDIFLLEKAVYEIIYELKNRPGWARIPLDGILELLALDESR